MGKRFKGLFIGIVVALVLMLVLPNAIFAAQTPMSATGNVKEISGAMGFMAGNSGNFKVTSRTVNGSFSGDLSGDYIFTFKGNIDLNTQSGNISGKLTTSTHDFDISGRSEPFSMQGNELVSSASGSWEGSNWPGSGTFSATYYFQLDEYGHIISILDKSTFSFSGKWNLQ